MCVCLVKGARSIIVSLPRLWPSNPLLALYDGVFVDVIS